MVIVIIVSLLCVIGVLIYHNAQMHYRVRQLQRDISILTHPSRQAWGCVCGAVTFSARSEISDGRGMTHRAMERCIPDLEVVP